jgi:hypothetical protein
MGGRRFDDGSMQYRAIRRPNAAAEHRANFGYDRQSRAPAAIVAFTSRDEKAAPGACEKQFAQQRESHYRFMRRCLKG